MTNNDTKASVRARFESESPRGKTPREDRACADCGSYCELFGPMSFDGRRIKRGDFVCESCAKNRLRRSA